MRLLSILFLLLLPVCSSEEPGETGPNGSNSVPTASRIDLEGFEKISLARTGCYGFCPTYEVTIHADGLVVYQGFEHVGVIGERQGKTSAEAIAELVNACRQLNFFELEDKYEHKFDEDGQAYTITDQPSRIMTLTVKGKSKEVEQYFGGPEALRTLADQIDTLAGTAAWTKKADE